MDFQTPFDIDLAFEKLSNNIKPFELRVVFVLVLEMLISATKTNPYNLMSIIYKMREILQGTCYKCSLFNLHFKFFISIQNHFSPISPN